MKTMSSLQIKYRRSIVGIILLKNLWPFYPKIIEFLIDFFSKQDLGFEFLDKSILIISILVPFGFLPDLINRNNFIFEDLKNISQMIMWAEILPLVIFTVYLFDESLLLLFVGLGYLIFQLSVFNVLEYLRYKKMVLSENRRRNQ